MRPRTLAILAFVLLVGSVGLRQVVTYFGLLPVSEEVVLKKAVGLTVVYYVNGKAKSQVISEPAELKDALAALKIDPREEFYTHYYGWGNGSSASVEFWFPDGTRRRHAIEGPVHLGSYRVDPAFFRKLVEIINKREGKAIDLSRGPPVIPGVFIDDGKLNDQWDNSGGKGW
ncbi:MAG TPA: hypothetical protein VE988_15310 [Gemmataceae bacterium]|nr:hypothetical protein [Gemmataceae bacterium]